MTLIGPQVDSPCSLPQNQKTAPYTTKRQRCSPLELPEILVMLGRHLPRDIVVVCLRVCHMWHQALLPWVWSSIKSRDTENLPQLSALETHAPLVRELYIRNSHCASLWGTVHFAGLTVLSISFPGSEKTVDLIQQHQSTLLFLSVSCFYSPELLEAILGCQRLEKLHFFKACINVSEWIVIYERLLHRLKVLTLSVSPRSTPNDPESLDDSENAVGRLNCSSTVAMLQNLSLVWESASVGKIQDLTFRGGDIQAHFEMIRKCPDLVRLSWCCPVDTTTRSPMHLLVQELQYGTGLDQLESLGLQQAFSNAYFTILIDRLPKLSALDLSCSSFDRQSWQLLKGSALSKRLKSLNLMKCPELSGSTLQDIMCSLVGLVTFKAELISETDLENDKRNWVCSGLKELRICFAPVKKPYEDVIALRLAQLTNLEVLDLDYSRLSLYLSIDGRENEFGVLDRLRTLRSMKSFRVLLSSVAWNNIEFEWVLEHWPKLRNLYVPVCGGNLGILAGQVDHHYY
ncbi:hypothetical protein EMPS_05085 [Entomortierella parvispora]|uniref:F-box domain-containing protein n=1 Tax=Entomortierella parvispora TaxID=205924 RepID=A0A9P3LW48_9FUNG|nr:hypothetical protein EMPS_05085 [Entomortierella parvispora]